MELILRVREQVKAGRRNDRFDIYSALYQEISGKQYTARCGACACKFLYKYLQGWYEQNKLL